MADMEKVEQFIVLKDELNKAKHENQMLKNRCHALTQGTMCWFCPYECDNREKKFRGQV